MWAVLGIRKTMRAALFLYLLKSLSDSRGHDLDNIYVACLRTTDNTWDIIHHVCRLLHLPKEYYNVCEQFHVDSRMLSTVF